MESVPGAVATGNILVNSILVLVATRSLPLPVVTSSSNYDTTVASMRAPKLKGLKLFAQPETSTLTGNLI